LSLPRHSSLKGENIASLLSIKIIFFFHLIGPQKKTGVSFRDQTFLAEDLPASGKRKNVIEIEKMIYQLDYGCFIGRFGTLWDLIKRPFATISI
jgi:hypothetical protein